MFNGLGMGFFGAWEVIVDDMSRGELLQLLVQGHSLAGRTQGRSCGTSGLQAMKY